MAENNPAPSRQRSDPGYPQPKDQAPSPSPSQRDPAHLSATDEDRPNLALQNERSSGAKAPFDVFTPKGFKPFYPEAPDPTATQSSETNPHDNPFNPKGQPSLSLPQQATPLTSLQGVLSIDEMADQAVYLDIAATQDGLAPDDPRNPRGSPDYIVEEPSPQSNPDDQQHDGRTSHEQTEPVIEPQTYWEDENPNAPASR